MFPSKLPLLLLGFIVLGTALTYVQAMPVDEYDDSLNDIDNEIFEEEIAADKNGAIDDEEVEEGDAEERNVFNELDAEAEAEDAKIAEEEEIGADQDEDDEFEEEIIADAEEESDEADKSSEDEEEAAEEEEKSIADEEEAVEEEEKAIADEEEEVAEAEERAAEEEENIVDEDGDGVQKPFPYNWYDKVKKFFKGRK